MRQTRRASLHCCAEPRVAAHRNSKFRAQCATASSQLVERRSFTGIGGPARAGHGDDRNGAVFLRQHDLLDGAFRAQTHRRTLFPGPLGLACRAGLELARRPYLQCAVLRPGIGGTFGFAACRAEALMLAWIAAAIAVFYSLWSVAL